MSKSQEKKSTSFPKYFQQNRHFLKKIQIFRKYKVYFQILEVLAVILTTYLYRKILLQKIIEKQNIKNTKTIYRNYSTTPPPPHNITKYPICTKHIIYIYIYICTYVYTYTQTHPHTHTCINAYKHT